MKNNIPSSFRFDGKVYRLKLTDRDLALNFLIQYLDKYPFICAKQLQYLY
jgi:hypothetical protein